MDFFWRYWFVSGDAFRKGGLEIHSNGVTKDGAEHGFSVSTHVSGNQTRYAVTGEQTYEIFLLNYSGRIQQLLSASGPLKSTTHKRRG